MILGTISAIDDDNGIQLIIDGEDTATTKKYSYVASYVPAVDDRVLVEEISGSYVIIGKVITETSESGRVNYATNATNATNAENAEEADHATSATSADSATNAARATKADSADSADSLSTSKYNSSYGMLVTSVTRVWDGTLSKYIVTDVQTDYSSKNYVYKY